MQHTYLRYECADTFSLTTATPSAATNTTQTLALFDSNEGKKNTPNTRNRNQILLSTAGSQCVGFDFRSGNPPRPYMKIGHNDDSTNIGTGNALNSLECTCLDVLYPKICTGWMDGSIRIFHVSEDDENSNKIEEGMGVVRSLLHPDSNNGNRHSMNQSPLVLNGHSNSPITCVSFDKNENKSLSTTVISRLASGSADGSIVLWDIIAETGLFRLLGHAKTITTLHFIHPTQRDDDNDNNEYISASFDGLVSTSLDGLVKIWDLDGQCCSQTVAGHRGEVWTADSAIFEDKKSSTSSSTNEKSKDTFRWRIVTGASDNELRFWNVHIPKRSIMSVDNGNDDKVQQTNSKVADEDAISYMGSLQRQTNEHASHVKFYPPTKLLGVSAHQSKNIEIYSMRSVIESQKRRVRRLRRRREKEGKKANQEDKNKKTKGMLDDEEEWAEEVNTGNDTLHPELSTEQICASDEFTYLGMVRASHKVRSFVFAPATERGGGTRIILSLATNSIEVHSVQRKFNKDDGSVSLATRKITVLDQYGHPTGIRSVSLSPTDDKLATTISKGMLKVWSTPTRSCIRSLPLHYSDEGGATSAVYALCCSFLPSNSHVVVGTREGHILLIDIASGDVVCIEEKAHDGAIWDLNVTNDGTSMVTGSADRTAKFWEFEDDDGNPVMVHTRTLEMKDDIVSVQYSYSHDKRLVMVATLDCTIQIYFEDNLKFFLNLYGHKLPALAMDCSDDDTILASGGADKTIKIWGLDFGDIHKTLYGHTDSITDIKFVRKTHNFFSCGRDKTIRYWDGDRFDGILVLHGHFAEVNSLAISKTGAFVLSAGMDRQVRVWERTKDMVFIEEEKERELERILDQADGSRGEEKLSMRVDGNGDEDEENKEAQPQSEAAVRKSVLSVASGDRLLEAIELADLEMKEMSSKKNAQTSSNPLLLGMNPPEYIYWVLRSIKSAELEQSLLILPLNHMERLMYYLVLLLRKGTGVELCSKVAVFLVTTHQNQIIATQTLSVPLRELRRLVKERIGESRNTVGYNLAAMRAVAKLIKEHKEAYFINDDNNADKKDIWAGLGKGSDVAAALSGRGSKRVKR